MEIIKKNYSTEFFIAAELLKTPTWENKMNFK
jgi:hypothetical protein